MVDGVMVEGPALPGTGPHIAGLIVRQASPGGHTLDAYQKDKRFRGICVTLAHGIPPAADELSRRGLTLDGEMRPGDFPALLRLAEVEHQVDTGAHRFPKGGQPWYRKILSEKQAYLQVLIPLMTAESSYKQAGFNLTSTLLSLINNAENVYWNAETFWIVNRSGAAGALPCEAALKAVYVPGAVPPKKRLCHPPSGAKAPSPQDKGVAVNDAPVVPN